MSLASRFTSNRLSATPSLQGVLLEVRGGYLNLYSTNLNQFFHTKIAVNEKKEVRVVVEVGKVMEFLALLEGGDITIEITEKKIVISKGKTKGSFPIMESTDFPTPPPFKETHAQMKGIFFAKKLPLVLFSASRDDSRPVLTAINFFTSGAELAMVSTDGFRLSLLKMKSEKKLGAMMVPADFLNEVLRCIKETDDVSLTTSSEDKTIKIESGDDTFYSRIIEGDFPDFQKVIPSDLTTHLTLDRDELIRNVKLSSVLSRDYSNIVIFDVTKEGLYIRPKTDKEEEGGSFQEVEMKGEPIRVAFNYKFVLEFLSNASGSKKIVMELLRSDAPVVFKIPAEKDYIHIIMPVRIQS
jgi:DNA polymerase-3 subunit beta